MTAWFFFICAKLFMTCWSTVECSETALRLVTEGCIVVSDHMLISILSMSLEPLEMLCAEAADALAPWAGNLKLKSLTPDVCLQELKFILNPVLPLGSLARLGLHEFAEVSPLGFKPSLAHLDRQLEICPPLLYPLCLFP